MLDLICLDGPPETHRKGMDEEQAIIWYDVPKPSPILMGKLIAATETLDLEAFAYDSLMFKGLVKQVAVDGDRVLLVIKMIGAATPLDRPTISTLG